MIGLCLLLASLAGHVLTDCVAPVSLPVTNVELSDGETMRGVPIAVGTPSQNISFMFNEYLNDTWIFNSTTGFCMGNPKPYCLTYRGGLYDVAASITANPASSVYAAGGDPSDVQRTLGTHIWDSVWVNDVLALGNTSIPNFPIGMPGFDTTTADDTQSSLGLGFNSTLLNALKSAGKIAGRSWSFWWGLNGATSDVQMDGSIVFGGYDQAKTVGNSWTQPLQTPSLACLSGMVVTVTNVVLSFPNGTQASITAPNQFSVCLQPDFALVMTILQTPYYENFEAFTATSTLGTGGGSGLDWGGQVYPPDAVFDGSLIIELNNGAFTAEIPNDILVVPPQQITNDGSISTNSSVAEVLIIPTYGVNEQNYGLLGRPFFSSVYLTVDFDAGTFTMWKANPTQDTALVPLGNHCSAAKGSPTTVSSVGHTKPTGSSNQTRYGYTAQNHSSLGPAKIGGIIAGGVVGAIVVTACLVWCCKRKRRTRNERLARELNVDPSRHGMLHSSHESTTADRMQELQTHEKASELVTQGLAWELHNKTPRSSGGRLLDGWNGRAELP